MNNLEVIGLLAGLVNLASGMAFIRSVLKGTEKPERAAHIIWLLTTSVIFVTNIAEGAEESVWFLLSDLIVVALMVVFSIKRGYKWVESRDFPGLIIALVGIGLWIKTGNPLTALILNVFVDSIASVLVFIKTWEAPKTENLLSWQLYLLASVLATISVGKLDFALLLYPVYTVLMSLVIIFIISTRTKTLKEKRKRGASR